MRVLITSSRLPFALDEVRKLGKLGHQVFCSDTFRAAPGSHSRYAVDWFITASPRYEPSAFVRDVRSIVDSCSIDLVLPAFEEALWLALARDELPGVELFVSPLEVMDTLHHKGRFVSLMRRLGLRVPETQLAESSKELAEIVGRMDRFFARPAYSRAGVELFTNVGPLAGALELEDCSPSKDNPWLVQPFVEGTDVCTFSIAHRGKIGAHSAYVHPESIDHAGGIVFASIEHDEAFEVARRVIAEVRYTGQISFDFIDTGAELVCVECNPRPTNGAVVMPDDDFEAALFETDPLEPRIAPAGTRRKLSTALVRGMLQNWREASQLARHLVSDARDVYYERGDPLPAIYQVLSYSQVFRYKLRSDDHSRSALIAGYLDDIRFDGPELARELMQRGHETVAASVAP